MSHVTGTVQQVLPALDIGPDFGVPGVEFEPAPAPPPLIPPGGIKLVILHFTNATFPANNRLEVTLGYGTDVFSAADGSDFWTRPINLSAFPNGKVPIQYVTDGAATGGVRLVEYGRGERHEEEGPPHDSYSNCDPFLIDGAYTEPQYDPFWFCETPPDWENVVCIPGGDIRETVARSVCMLVAAHGDALSTCSATLIGPDLVITAGHCVEDPDAEVPTMSVTFDYATDCLGGKPLPYNPVFHKVLRYVEYGTLGPGSLDYIILQVKAPPGGLGVAPLTMRADLPAAGENVFGVHHPNGAVKKVGPKTPAFATVLASSASAVTTDIDVSGGSSGSGLFDALGRFVGVLSNGTACNLSYSPSATILQDIATQPAPSPDRDVMIVFDRSGSMSMDAGTGRTKMEEAHDAASLFVQLVRSGVGHRIGLVSFSTTASAPVDYDLKVVNTPHKEDLIGPPPHSAGIVGGLAPGGTTTIGGGLDAARSTFPAPGPATNLATILLLTDGLQNTPPMVEDVIASLEGVEICAIGFGTESSLNGGLLTQLAQTHGGIYTRAGTGLELKKFFALCFGDIFEAGALLDPEYLLPADRSEAEPIPFTVCEESSLTVALGWESETSPLTLYLETPSGKRIRPGDRRIESSRGKTWRFLRLPLPHRDEQNGTWKVHVAREDLGEFSVPVDVHFFVSVIAQGGPVLARKDRRTRYYTGDAVNPVVALYKGNGFPPPNPSAKVVVTRPNQSAGNILTRTGLRPPGQSAGDTLPARFATLQRLEAETKRPAVTYGQVSLELFDDGTHGDGAMEPDGIFGNPVTDLLTNEGSYTFRAIATYGEDCTGSRELTWSVHADIGIDPAKTEVVATALGDLPDGRTRVRVVFTPKDRYGNHLGPGRLDAIQVLAQPGTTLIGGMSDAGNGSYAQDVAWDPASAPAPTIAVTQPERPPVVVAAPSPQAPPTRPGTSCL